MKNRSIALLLGVVLISTVQVSCSTDIEPLDSNIILNPDGNQGGGGSTNPISSGDYWPLAVGNSWNFLKDDGSSMDCNIIASEQIDGKTYYRFDNFIGQTGVGNMGFEGSFWARKSGANYYLRQGARIPGNIFQPEVIVRPFDIIILKDNLNVNQTWTENSSQTVVYDGQEITTPVNFVGKILEKNTTIVIGNQTFTNVIKTELIQTTQGESNTNYYWFAKDIGLIQSESSVLGTTYRYSIISYSVQ